MSYYAFEGLIPVDHPTAFVHPSAVLIGDVIVGAGVYVGPLASLRAVDRASGSQYSGWLHYAWLLRH